MDAWEHVAANMRIPIAMGERLYTIYQFRDLLSHNGAAYIRPDLSLAGGITNIRRSPRWRRPVTSGWCRITR